jgi:hypothetical protein
VNGLTCAVELGEVVFIIEGLSDSLQVDEL